MANTYSNLLYHMVFSTKGRRPLIQAAFKERLYEYVGGIVRAQKGVLLQIGGVADHVHLVVKLRPDTAVAVMLRLIKANSSKWVHETINDPLFAWQTGYSAFTVSESQLDKLINYVRNQEEHHRQASYEDELLDLLRKHGIEFDERYVWD